MNVDTDVTSGDLQGNHRLEGIMTDAVFLGGDRYHKAEEAHAGIGPVLEKAGLDVHYTDDLSLIHI